MPGIPALALIAGAWFGFRVVNWPRFADFLIAVEAEMNKVTWPSKDELIRAAIVVIFTIFFLAIALFLVRHRLATTLQFPRCYRITATVPSRLSCPRFLSSSRQCPHPV